MNAAKASRSDRLKRVLKVLRRGGAYSTRDIMRQAHVCAVSAAISELRANKYRIGCKRHGMVWRYMLEGRA